jgi:membrane peptidoglycan carboxypeptidase
VGEDHRFPTHFGVDPWAVARAIVRTFLKGKREGASTIQQQLVRVMTGRYEITLRRKLREMAFAIALGSCFEREDLCELYLVHGYYGCGMSGIVDACRLLGINPTVANTVEAARIVARLRYPEPRVKSSIHQARVEQRANYILAKLNLGKRRNEHRHRMAPGVAAHVR